MDYETERREAIAAGQRALSSLQAAKKELRSARNWGIADMLGSRSFFSSVIKHGKMNNAKVYMDQARNDLACFSRELRDVSVMCDFGIETNDFVAFTDVFMDNFFSDWAMQSRIADAAQQVDEAIGRVKAVLDRLQNNRFY